MNKCPLTSRSPIECNHHRLPSPRFIQLFPVLATLWVYIKFIVHWPSFNVACYPEGRCIRCGGETLSQWKKFSVRFKLIFRFREITRIPKDIFSNLRCFSWESIWWVEGEAKKEASGWKSFAILISPQSTIKNSISTQTASEKATTELKGDKKLKLFRTVVKKTISGI